MQGNSNVNRGDGIYRVASSRVGKMYGSIRGRTYKAAQGLISGRASDSSFFTECKSSIKRSVLGSRALHLLIFKPEAARVGSHSGYPAPTGAG